MIAARLLRFADTPFGVFGYLDLEQDGVRLARFATAEDDWLDNAARVSCIPAGAYTCRRGFHPRTNAQFEITGVPRRSAILIHAGNGEEDVEGCVLLGESFGARTIADEDVPSHPVVSKWAVVQSRDAITRFHALLHGVDTFALTVEWAAPGAWRDPMPVPPRAA